MQVTRCSKGSISTLLLGFFLIPCGTGRSESLALVGGSDGTTAYAAFVDATSLSAGPPLENLPSVSGAKIKAVSLNQYGLGFIGGVSTFLPTTPYAAFVLPGTNIAGSAIDNLPPAHNNNFINSVGLNNRGLGIVGGQQVDLYGSYAAFCSVESNAAGAAITNLIGDTINGVAVNNSNNAVVASITAYAAFVDFNTNAAGSTILNLPGASVIQQVDINNANQVIIGGSVSNAAYAAFVDFNTNTAGASVLNLPSAPGSCIGRSDLFIPGNGVAINNRGQVLIGGTDGTGAYAAFVDLSTNTAGAPISNLPTTPGSLISGVAINAFGQGFVGGYDGTKAYAAFVDPLTNSASNPISGLPTAAGSIIYSVAFVSTISLPTVELTGNNKIFAKYINKYAPQDRFYFVPSFMEGSLAEALEVTAPTRNAIALFMADNQLCSLNQGLSAHLRNHRHFQSQVFVLTSQKVSDQSYAPQGFLVADADEEVFYFYNEEDYEVYNEEDYEDDLFIADASFSPSMASTSMRSNGIWLEGIGFLASQKAQHQTVGFSPSAGGVILGWDRWASSCWKAGVGAAYMFTHVDQHRDQGKSNINQECLFGYASWSSRQFYFNAALWGSAFQTSQQRNMELTGWHFHATSHPNGWQLSPHVEGGYEYTLQTRWFSPSGPSFAFIAAPFVMIDWVNAWQGAYKEHGNGPFNAGQRSHYSSFLRSEAGLRYYECFGFSRWRLLVGEGLSYVNKTPFDVGKVTAFLVGSPGSFTVETLTHSENLARVELSTQFEPQDLRYPYGSLAYYGEFAPSFSSQQVVLELSWDF